MSDGLARSAVFRTAALGDYIEWLTKWISAGGQPTHYCHYPFNGHSWLVAEQDFHTGGECGANSAEVIVPRGVRYLGGPLGHNNLFMHSGPKKHGHFVPVYSDPEFLKLGLAGFIAKEQERHRLLMLEVETRARDRQTDYPDTDIKRHYAVVRDAARARGTANPVSDDAFFQAFAGARFAPGAQVILPSGKAISGAEAQARTSLHAEDAPEPDTTEQPKRRWWRKRGN